jgi:tetratricopeptide (TPR) repeat protein
VEGAIEAFTEAITLNPRLAHAYSWRAGAYMIIKQNAKALSDINKALELQPENAEFYGIRASIYMLTECDETSTTICEKALADIERAIKMKPDNPQFYLVRAGIYGQAKMNDKAIEDLSRITAMRQGEWPDFLALAYMSRAQIAKDTRGDNHAALADLTSGITVLKNSKYYAEKLKKFADIMNDMRKKGSTDEEIVSSAAKAFHVDPKNEKEMAELRTRYVKLHLIFALYVNRSGIYRDMGLKDKAESDMKTACEILWKPIDCVTSTERRPAESFD